MKKNVTSSNKLEFQYSKFNRIDSKKHNLYDVLSDPKLDNVTINERLSILNSLVEDAQLNEMGNFLRYSSDGCSVVRNIFDPSLNKTINMINFGSNDYLNMSQHPEVINAGIEALEKYGAGAGASCITTGQTKVLIDLEKEIAETFEYESSLVYPCGYMANTGVLGAMLKKNDVAVVDLFAHASILDGVESKNKMFFLHNDMRSLETVLNRVNKQYVNKIVVVDGVYSMDGDIANLPDISGLCKKYGATLMVDEAHAFGVIGQNGLGILDHFNMKPESIDILVGTLSKAVGCSGGFVTGKKELINYLKLASRPHFFTTAPFISANASALTSIKIIKQDSNRRKQLWKNIDYFKSKLRLGNFNIGNSETAICPIIIGNNNQVIEMSRLMGIKGVLTTGAVYPAVARKQARIRMTVTSQMTLEQIDESYLALCSSNEESQNRVDLDLIQNNLAKERIETYIKVNSLKSHI